MTKTEQNRQSDGDRLRTIAQALLAAHRLLGPEHQALAAEERETRATERQGTVRRMREDIEGTASWVAAAAECLATVYGMRALGLSGQMSEDTDGRKYSPLKLIGKPEDTLLDMSYVLDALLNGLSTVYRPTKKAPGLAKARRPAVMKQVLDHLEIVVTEFSAELTAAGMAEEAVDLNAWRDRLARLGDRITVVPRQGSTPSPDEVVAAILADPAVASAAAAALART